VKGCRSVRKQVAPRQQLFASRPPATSSSEICWVCIFASCRCLFPPADLRLRHLFISSECNCTCMQLTASSRVVMIVMATFCTVCLLACRCTCPCNKPLCISFTLLRRTGGSEEVASTPGDELAQTLGEPRSHARKRADARTHKRTHSRMHARTNARTLARIHMHMHTHMNARAGACTHTP